MRIWKTFLRFAEIREKWRTQEDKQEAVKDEEQQTDAQFWSNQPDPVLIERGTGRCHTTGEKYSEPNTWNCHG